LSPRPLLLLYCCCCCCSWPISRLPQGGFATTRLGVAAGCQLPQGPWLKLMSPATPAAAADWWASRNAPCRIHRSRQVAAQSHAASSGLLAE
jgi:hypothetical protein